MNRIEEVELDDKIALALERVSTAFKALLINESRKCGLSPIQMQLLLFLHSEMGKQTFKPVSLAIEFKLTKATVSDALVALQKKGLIEKMGSATDLRSIGLTLTETGKHVAFSLSSFNSGIISSLQILKGDQKVSFFSNLLEVIEQLNKQGLLNIQRTCLSCRFYTKSNSSHYCNLIRSQLLPTELKVNCWDHEVRI